MGENFDKKKEDKGENKSKKKNKKDTSNKKYQKKDEAWKKVPPKEGDPKEKQLGKYTFQWCEHHMAWTARQSRHLSYVAEFTSDIRHIAGEENIVADSLSRPPGSPLHHSGHMPEPHQGPFHDDAPHCQPQGAISPLSLAPSNKKLFPTEE